MATRHNPRIINAFRAMKEYGFSEDVVKPHLKNLFKVFDKNWEFIEDENYMVLIDAIVEAEEGKKRKSTDNDVPHEPEHPLKKQRPNHEDQDLFSIQVGSGASSGTGTTLQGANLNSDSAIANIGPEPLQDVMDPPKPLVSSINPMDESEPDSPPTGLRLRDRRLTSSKALVIAEASDSPQPCKTNEVSYFSQVGQEDQSNENISSKHPRDEERTYSESSPYLLDSKKAEVDPHLRFPPETASTICDTNATSFVEDVRMDSFPLNEVGICEIGNQAGSQGVSNIKDTEEGFARQRNSDGTGKSVSIKWDNLHQSGTKEMTYMLDATDITKGEEKVKISIVNHYNDVPFPSFCYIRQSLVGQNAVVNVSLARIGNKDCCQKCVVDCSSVKEPCICACTTEGKCGYASDGILNDKFLEQNISMALNPQKHRQFFCEDCPLEVGIDKDAPKPCQGHLVRKVVNECWLKCICNRNCTNRRVQRGINYKLQVFMTSGGKGWGLRTLVDLQKGAFICEYVGEILTLSEHYLRYQTSLQYCAYTMILDAGWASSKEIKDDKNTPLCLDASVYGNVARFINHRCTDANLVAIPVRVETSDHLYHRVAFFTSRKIYALEELTRDYGTNFDDVDGVTKPFRCRCGSSFCRNIKRYNRKRLKGKTPKSLIPEGERLGTVL